MKHKTITSKEAEPHIRAGTLKPAGLYEPLHAPKGTKFVHVDFGKGVGSRFMRFHPPKELPKKD